MSNINIRDGIGCYVDDQNTFTFQLGDKTTSAWSSSTNELIASFSMPIFAVDGYTIYPRGKDNRSCERVEHDIKNNRLLPRLIAKQVELLYGKGPAIYKTVVEEGKVIRKWVEQKEVQGWLESWQDNGIEMSYKDFGMASIKRYYTFRDYFVKWRFSRGKNYGFRPVVGLELVENKQCRLAMKKENAFNEVLSYSDFRFVIVGNWLRGLSSHKVYPLFRIQEIDNYQFAAISHHRESSIDDFYGVNETHEGIKTFLKTSNELPLYIDSFLSNSLAAKVHVIIPNAWVESKRKQITALCEENKRRAKDNLDPLLFNGIDIGNSFKESTLIKYVKLELSRFSQYLSGAKNQGKAYSSISFKDNGEEVRWKIETIDLKYKEYIDSLIAYDKRTDEVLLSAVGMDSSISSVSKDGVISKSGSDVFYNYLLYLLSLTSVDDKCCEAFNMALRVNFPELYKEGYRIGYYREMPQRQEDTPPKDRIEQQNS